MSFYFPVLYYSLDYSMQTTWAYLIGYACYMTDVAWEGKRPQHNLKLTADKAVRRRNSCCK